MALRVLIAGGGTAGHVYPGIALARAIRSSRPDSSVSFVGTARGIETAAVPSAGFHLFLIDVVPWAKTLGAKRFAAPLSLAAATRHARKIIERERPDVVVGMGGYASLPVVVAARTKRVPALIHEQNAVPGLANVVAARLTPNVALGFEEARAAFPSSANVRVVGNPIRESIASLDRVAARAEARASLELKPDVPTVVVFGGSLGAARLGHAAAALATRWRDRTDRQLLVIAGPKHVDDVRASVPAGAPCVVLAYLDRMDQAYAAADLVVSRAGAASVAEIAAVGLPSLLVPYPYARRDHQSANARSLARDGGAVALPDDEATPDRVTRMVEGLLADEARLASMAESAKRHGRPDAARRLAQWVDELSAARR